MGEEKRPSILASVDEAGWRGVLVYGGMETLLETFSTLSTGWRLGRLEVFNWVGNLFRSF